MIKRVLLLLLAAAICLVLAVYLGSVDGRAIRGLDEASRAYFGRSPQTLTVEEAAMLAGLIRTPTFSPIKHPEIARARREEVLRRMRR